MWVCPRIQRHWIRPSLFQLLEPSSKAERSVLLVGLPLKPRSQHRQQSAKEADDPNRSGRRGNHMAAACQRLRRTFILAVERTPRNRPSGGGPKKALTTQT